MPGTSPWCWCTISSGATTRRAACWAAAALPLRTRRTDAGKIERAAALRRTRGLTCARIAERLGLSQSTVARACQAAGLARSPPLQEAPPVCRYCRSPWREDRADDDRQWSRLPITALCQAAAAAEDQAPSQQTLYAAHPWQGQALHPDTAARMG
ncbi:hypothetical protein CK625_04265 [Vandammella animalimorsus]|uniref:Uncharacterized protein n=1 Tax=Vandammella animalimorsus TaxID=2029117 RepID=A0A2A2AM26_9BURK|nr:hypothetical protein CK625_04265 [Vandammella animalimorsus]